MKIKKIRMKNFKSIGGKFVSLTIPENGLLLVQGQNGVGKTTLFSALNYGLFGKNSDVKGESKTSIPASELVNDINKKDMLVELELSNGYIIRRGSTPDIFEILDPEGINVADKSSKVIDQQWLEQELLGGLSYQMFHKLVYISAKSVSTPFLYLTPSQRKEFIEHILDIRILYYIGEVIKKKQSELKLDLKTVSDKLSMITSSILAEENNLANLKTRRDQQIAQLNEMKQNKQTLIDEAHERIHQLKVEKSSLHTTLQFIETDIENFKTERARIEALIIPGIDQELSLLESQVNQIKQEMLRRKNEKDVFEKNLEGFQQCGTCSTLKTIVGEFDYPGYQKFIEDSKHMITTLLSRQEQVKRDLEYQDSLKQDLNDKTSDLRDLQYKLQSTQKDMEAIDEKVTKEESLIRSLESQLDSIKPIEVDETYLMSLKEQQETISNSHDTLVNKQEQLDLIKKRVGDKSIKRELLEYYIPVFEQKINDLMSIFMEDDPFTFSIKLTEDFDIEGFKNGRKTNIFKFSEGQKSSINFAFLMAVQHLLALKNSFSFDFLAIDEILDSALDSSRLDKIVRHLSEVAQNKPVMIISHNASLQTEYFDQIIKVERVNGFTEYCV